MVNMNLTEWAALAETLGVVTVVVSLLLVVRSISQNTSAMRISNDNFVKHVDAVSTANPIL